MSRGPGHIETKLLRLFSQQPPPLTTAQICQYVYDVAQVEKKHRVAVLRALKRLGKKRSIPTLWRMVQRYERSDDVWFDHHRFPKRSDDCAPAADERPRK
jgi:hypothetical protein